jgi:hypothetical protein
MRLRSLVFVAFFATALSTPAVAQPSGKRQFPAQVKNGVLRGETGVAESAGWLRIEGPIGADGSARLDANGRTGDPDHAVQHPPPSSPYSFHIDARFEGAAAAAGASSSALQLRLRAPLSGVRTRPVVQVLRVLRLREEEPPIGDQTGACDQRRTRELGNAPATTPAISTAGNAKPRTMAIPLIRRSADAEAR